GCTSANKTNINTDDPDKAFDIAMKSYNSKDYTQAVEDFSLIKIKFSGSKNIDKAQFYLGMSYYKREEYVLAAYEFENLLKNYTSSEFQVEARYMLAMCYYSLSPDYFLDQTYTRYAIIEFQNFLIINPKDKKVPEVETKIKELRNKLALKEFSSGLLYLKMDRYRAAQVYFDNVLTEYYDTDYADDASYNKIKVLVIRKKIDDAKKEIASFENKYKSSIYYSQVETIKKSLQ
ncbi:MAG TPA: outer membrane protein assembly factor BamD, partial [Ignavibacteria bacterium]|nr:outer membrane protein assembly factor BamD [Ignavibacteria bacterium]